MAGQNVARVDMSRVRAAENNSAEALRVASEALTRLTGHEERCGDRYEAIQISNSETRASLTRIHARIDDLSGQFSGRWFYVLCAVISALTGVIGFLLVAGTPLNGG